MMPTTDTRAPEHVAPGDPVTLYPYAIHPESIGHTERGTFRGWFADDRGTVLAAVELVRPATTARGGFASLILAHPDNVVRGHGSAQLPDLAHLRPIRPGA